MKKRLGTILAFLCLLLAWGCAGSSGDASDDQSPQVVNVYSHRHYDTDQQLFKRFEELTGIEVKVVKASADELIQRLEAEGQASPADVLITVDAGRLHRAKSKGLLEPIDSSTLKSNIPVNLRDPEGYWFGLTKRARVVVFSKDRVDPADLATYEALVNSEWKGKILVRSSSNIYNQSLLASLIAASGREAAKSWAQGIAANFARSPKGNDRDQVKAIAAGEGDVAIVNTYYLGRLLNSDNPEERKAGQAVGVFFPNQDGRGTHINVSGAGLTSSSKNRENAIRFLEFLSGEEAQSAFAQANFEYPANERVEASELLDSWGKFKGDPVNLAELGRNNSEAVKIFDEVGWP